METGRIGQESRTRSATPRRFYAGMGAGLFWHSVVAVVIFLISALLFGVRWVLGEVPEISEIFSIPDTAPGFLWEWGEWFAIAGIIAVLLLILRRMYPVQAITLWIPREENKRVRRTGLRIARNWKKYAAASFDGVVTDAGDRVFPGLRSVREKDGELVLKLVMPDQRVRGGRQKWAEDGAAELRAEAEVQAVELKPNSLKGRFIFLYVIVRDETEETRGVGE